MNINIERAAIDYIKKHTTNNSITLFVKSVSGGWCSVQTPTVQLGKPDFIDKFDMHNIDEISVYVSKGIRANNNVISVYIKKFLWIQSLEVDGILH